MASKVIVAVVLLLGNAGNVFGADSSEEAKEKALERIENTPHTILGMHDNSGGDQADGFETVTKLCGTRPDLWSAEFGFSTHPNESVRNRSTLLRRARRQHKQGVLITLSWHQCNPTIDEPCTFGDGVQRPLEESQWKELLEEGSALNKRWKKQVDRLAAYLRVLKQDGIAVLIRPYHEANIPGFWWAHDNATHSKAIWKQLRRYYDEHHGLTNLIWVWSASYHPRYWKRVADYYPGDDLVDVLGVDIYPPIRDGIPEFENAWSELRRIAPSKPIALSEVSRLPSIKELKARNWAYVVPWGKTMLFRDNKKINICSVYTNQLR